MLDQWLAGKLEDRSKKDLLRTLQGSNLRVDFTSNDYLGLARSEKLFHAIQQEQVNASGRNGSTGSRLLSGNLDIALAVERKLAVILQSQAALLFNSGYAANLAVLSSIPQKDDTIIYDELAHASIKDGARLSLAKKYSFKHNDLHDLEKKILRSTGKVFVVVESIYSMDGDECPLAEVTDLAKRTGCIIVLDEAHSTGVRGPKGAGIAVEKSLHDIVDVRIYTFGKAMGVCGACVAGSQFLIDYLVNFARPFIYTTAPSPHSITAIGCAFDFLSQNMRLQNILNDRVTLFVGMIGDIAHRTNSLSAIQTIIVPGNTAARKAALRLQHEGFDVRPILSPTVPQGSERLRICLHTFNTEQEVERLAGMLKRMTAEKQS